MSEKIKLRTMNSIQKPKLSDYLELHNSDSKFDDIYKSNSGRELRILENLVPVYRYLYTCDI